MGNKNQHKKNFKNNKNKNNNKPQHNRSENLSTSIGDILKAKGMLLPQAEKADEIVEEVTEEKPVEEPKKTIEELQKTGIDLSKVSAPINIYEESVVKSTGANPYVYESSVKDLVGEFLAKPEDKEKEKKEPTAKFHIGAEYVTMDGTDKRIRTDTFVQM